MSDAPDDPIETPAEPASKPDVPDVPSAEPNPPAPDETPAPPKDPEGDPGGAVLEMLKIELRRDGRVNLSGPLKDKGVCYLMLELARDAIRDFEMRQMMVEAQKRAAGIVGASEIPPGLDGMGPRELAMPPGFRPVPRGFRGRG